MFCQNAHVRRTLCGVAAAVLSGVLLLAQQAPTFRSRTDRVIVDFQAITSDGTPVADLRPEELTLKVGGKVREIKSLDFVKLAEAETPMASIPVKGQPPKNAAPPPAFGSNLQGDSGRSVFLVIDDESMLQGQERQARDAAERFVNALPPRDRVALMTVPYQAVTIDLTTSRQRVVDALRKITGHMSVPVAHLGGGADTAGCFPPSLVTFDVLRKLFESLTNISGPKTVVMISGGVRVEQEVTATHCQWPTLTQLHELGVLATRARIQLSFLQPALPPATSQMGSTTANDTLQGSVGALTDGAEDLVGAMGGELFKISAGGDAVFQKVARASSAYYLLAFDPEPDERDGKTHKISVSVSRPKVDLRARPEFEIDDPNKPSKPAAAKATTPEGALRDRRTYDELPLFVTAYAVRASDRSKMKVVVIADSPDQAAPLASASFALIDAKDKMMQWSAEPRDLTRRPMSSATLVAPGEYRLRVGARDANGRLGAADFEFNAKLTKAGNFDLIDLLVGVQRADEFLPKFVYSTEPSALGYLEIYAVDSGVREPAITLELAATADGPALSTARARLAPSREAGRFIVTGTLPIAALAPGDYVVRAIVKQGDKTVGTVLRTLRKTR